MAIETPVIAHYTFQSGATDDHTGGLDLTTTNSPAFSAGKVGNGMVVDLTAQSYASRANASCAAFQMGLDSMGISVWFYPTALPVSGNSGTIVYFGGGSTSEPGYHLLHNNSGGSGQFILRMSAGGVMYTATAAGPYPINRWYHLVGVSDRKGNMTLRVNDVQAASTSIAAAVAVDVQATVDFKVGGRYLTSSWTTGIIDELEIWRGIMPGPIYSRHWNGGDGISFVDFKDADEPNTYATHFIGHRLDKLPSDMASPWSTTNPPTVEANANGTYGRLLEWPSGGTASEKMVQNQHFAPSAVIQETVARVRWGTSEDGMFRLLLHSSGGVASFDTWMMYVDNGGWGFGKYNAHTFSFLGTEQAVTTTANVWYWLAFQAEPSGSDTILRGKFWTGAIGDEPGSWQYTHTVTGEQKTGRPGVGRFGTTGLVQVDSVFAGVGTNAPRALAFPTGATGYRYRVQVDTDAAEIPGTAATYLERTLAILNPNIPDVMKTLGGAQAASRGEIRASKDEDGLLQIPIDVIRWDLNATPADSECVINISRDILSDTNVPVYLWWGADDTRAVPWTLAENGQVNVYRAVIEEFLALNEDPTGAAVSALVERTANGRHGTSGGTMTSADQVEVIDGIRGLDFDGADDYFDTTVWSLPARDLTVSGLFTMRNMPQVFAMFGKHSSADANQFLFFVGADGEWHAFLDGTEGDSGVAAPTDGALHHIAFTVFRNGNTSSDARVYIDGVGVTGSWNIGIDLPTTWTGKAWTNQDWDATATRTDHPDGVQAFRQIVNVRMTADEIAIEANNLLDNASFWTLGTVEDLAGETEFTVDNAAVSVSAAGATIVQDHVVAPASSSVSVASDLAVITQNHVITVGNSSVEVVAQTVTITVGTTFDVDNAAVSVTAQGVTITQVHVILPANAGVSILAAVASILQNHVIAPANASVTITAQGATITLPSNLGSAVAALGVGLRATGRLGAGISATATLGT